MHSFKEIGVMHEPVHPVEIGIMQKEQPYKRQEIPGFSQLEKVAVIDLSLIPQCSQHQIGYRRENEHGNDAISNIPEIVFAPGEQLLTADAGKKAWKEQVKNGESEAGEQKIPARYFPPEHKPFMPINIH
jgi:hypothetical protein